MHSLGDDQSLSQTHLVKIYKKNLKFNEINVATNPDKRDEMLKRSNNARTVPQIFIGDHHVGGYVELRAINNSGELDKLVSG